MTVFALYENYYDNHCENWKTIINLYVNQADAIIAKLELDKIRIDDNWSYFVKEMNVL
jgi:hypothetical protein